MANMVTDLIVVNQALTLSGDVVRVGPNEVCNCSPFSLSSPSIICLTLDGSYISLNRRPTMKFTMRAIAGTKKSLSTIVLEKTAHPLDI